MPEISDEELAKYKADGERATNLEASKKRLEDENSKIKNRAKDAEDELSKAKDDKLKSENDIQGQLDKERTDHTALKDSYAKRTKITLEEKMKSEALKYAKDAHNIDAVLRVAEHKDLLKTDPESLKITGMEDFIKKVRETDPYMFGKKSLDDTDNLPPGGTVPDPNPGANKTEDQKYRDELKNCNTRLEMDAVYKKYNKQTA